MSSLHHFYHIHTCEICGQACLSWIGLFSHQRNQRQDSSRPRRNSKPKLVTYDAQYNVCSLVYDQQMNKHPDKVSTVKSAADLNRLPVSRLTTLIEPNALTITLRRHEVFQSVWKSYLNVTHYAHSHILRLSRVNLFNLRHYSFVFLYQKQWQRISRPIIL